MFFTSLPNLVTYRSVVLSTHRFLLGDQLGLNTTNSLVKECTTKIKAMADVRKLAVEDIDTIIRSFYDKLTSGKEENPLLENMTTQEKKLLAKKEMEFRMDAEELQTRYTDSILW